MSIAKQTALTPTSPRRIPSTVRLGPQVVNDLCAHPVNKKARADNAQGAAGLLFGTAEQDLLRVEAFKTFPAAESIEKGSPKRECLEAAFELSLATAKADPDLTSLHLVGWYCIRQPGDIAPLFDSDIEFHNRRFRRATDVALILNPKPHAGASIELYSRSSPKAAISREDYRSGLLLLGSAARINTPSDVAMRKTIDDDYYLRVFQVLNSLDRTEKIEGWKRIALRLKTITPLSLRPEWMRTRLAPDVHTTAPDSSGLPAKASPQVNSPLPGTRPAQTKLRWISSAVLLVLAMGVALAWPYARPLLSALPGKALFLGVPGSKSVSATHIVPNARPGTLAKTTPTPKEGPGFRGSNTTSRAKATPQAVIEKRPPDKSIRLGRNSPGPPVNARIAPAATSSIAPAPTPDRSGTTASRVRRPTTRKVLEPERQIQVMRNPAIIDPATPPTAERPSKKTDSSSGEPELRKDTQDLPPMESPVSSLQPSVTRNTVSRVYVPARPLKQVVPSTRSLEFSAPPGATDVEIGVKIDDQGRVTEARVVNNRFNTSELLTSAALAAAKQWIFEPAKMRGKSVPSDHTIEFHFHPKVGRP